MKNLKFVLPIVIVIGLVVWLLPKGVDNTRPPVERSTPTFVENTPNEENPSTRPFEAAEDPAVNMVGGSYQEYSQDAVAKALADGKKVVLFFHAKWCPTCRAADKAFNSNAGDLPKDLIVFKTDYDAERALTDKYSITYQHTFVQLDANMEQVTKWSGGDVETLLQNIK